MSLIRNVKEDSFRETFLCRVDLPQWRTFTSNQKLTVQNVPPTYSLDKISEFGARPPELVSVASLKLYFTAFIISKKVCRIEDFRNKIQSPLYHWIDGFGRIVLIDAFFTNYIR